jgi:hypothetical protein
MAYVIPKLKQQFGVGFKDGRNAIVKAIQIQKSIHPDWVILQLDIAAAFQNVSRQHLFQLIDQALNDTPALLHFTNYINLVYGIPTKAITRGTVHAFITSGVFQGDPAASLLFCWAINEAIISTIDILGDLGKIYVYMDDITIIAPQHILTQALNNLNVKLQQVSLKINLKKCAFLPNSPTAQYDLLTQYIPEPAPHGIIILGCPIGTPEFQESTALKAAGISRTKGHLINTIKSAQIRFLLIVFCLAPALNHLAAAIAPEILKEAAQLHMQAIHDTIIDMLAIPHLNNSLNDDQIQQLSLSHAHGGFAIHDLRKTSYLIYLATMRTSVSLLSHIDHSTAADFNQFIALQNDPIVTQLQACHAKLHNLEPQFSYPLNSINPATKAMHKLHHK